MEAASSGGDDILVLPSLGKGHLHPCVELCKYLSTFTKSRLVLIIPSNNSSDFPCTDFHPSIQVLFIKLPPMATPNRSRRHRDPYRRWTLMGIQNLLSDRYNNCNATRPACVILDVKMSWCRSLFLRKHVPIFGFYSSGAVHAAMQHAACKANAKDMKPGETRLLPGLPDCMALTYSDITRPYISGPHGLTKSGGNRLRRLRCLGKRDDCFKALLINTCHDMEGPFLDYLANQVETPVLGIGPLLPETYWRTTETLICHDRECRPSNGKSNHEEDDVIRWLDSKPSQSVIYISFGSKVGSGPPVEEYEQLANALRKSKRPFIWVIQPVPPKCRPPPPQSGDDAGGNKGRETTVLQGNIARKNGVHVAKTLKRKVDGKRGMVIIGWAPQLLILSHPATGGFLSHCGWNSTVEAMGRGVPILAWPMRGDQPNVARLVVDYLKIGVMVTSGDNLSAPVKKSDILEGIDRIMDDKEAHERAKNLSCMFQAAGLPSTSKASGFAPAFEQHQWLYLCSNINLSCLNFIFLYFAV